MPMSSSRGAAGSCEGPDSFADFVNSEKGRFSTELAIDLASAKPSEVFKWWLAAILFGARISEGVAARTYREFAKQGLTSPDRILRCGWDGVVAVLDRGGYVRYDFKTATKLLEVCGALEKRYGGDLNLLHARSRNPKDLEERLRELGKGIGDVTVGIFLREMRGIWRQAEPLPSDLVLNAAKELKFLPKNLRDKKRALVELKAKWTKAGGLLTRFADFEAALLRRGLAIRRASRKRDTFAAAPGRRARTDPRMGSV